ncbi:RNA-binding protein 33 [Gastrophryne carolinensis]
MAAMLEDDDFDQLDKPGAERSRRRRTGNDDWDSELEDDLLEEDFMSGKKTSIDLSDEELNDDLLQSDEEETSITNFSSQEVAVSLNATPGEISSFNLSRSINEQQPEEEEESVAEVAELQEAENEEVFEEVEDLETCAENLESFEDNYEVADEQLEYVDEETTDEVLDLEINEPLDEFQEEDGAQAYKRQKLQEEEQYAEGDGVEEIENIAEGNDEAIEEAEEQQDFTNDPEEPLADSQELPQDVKEESDDDDEEEEGDGRIRFKTERKEGTIIRISDTNRERRNIPDTLELSAEAKASLMEFEEMERQRKRGRFPLRRGGRRGGNNAIPRGMIDQRNDHDRRNNREQRSNQGQPIRTLFKQQQHIQPLIPIQRPRNSSSDGLSSPQQENTRTQSNSAMSAPPQPKNIHINPHFKGNVAPVQVPLLPVPNQPRPAMGPPRFPGMPDFQQVPGPVPGNLNQPPRLQEHWRNPPPPLPPQPEREPFFIGEPRFPNHPMFDQRNPPPVPPPPLLNNNLPVPNQSPPPFNPPGQGFPQPRFNPPPSNFNPPGPGPQGGFNPPGPQGGFNQPGFNPPGLQPGFNQSGPRPGFNPPGPQPGFNQPNFTPPGPPPGFNQSGPQPPFNPPAMNQPNFNQPNPGPQPGFNQPGSNPQPGFPQPGPGPQQGFNPGFSRERPARLNMPSPGPVGIPPFNQPSPNIRHFLPPRQFPPAPGQPFIVHNPPNMQGHVPPPIQPLHQLHPPGGQQKPLMHMQQTPQFRAHSQNPQTPTHRMTGLLRHPNQKPRQKTPSAVKVLSQQATQPRNSNLRELPIAPSHSVDTNKRKATSAPAAQIPTVGATTLKSRSTNGENTQASRPANTSSSVKAEVQIEEQFPDEDEETRKYRLKIEEQKRLREEILKRKEMRRQQQAGARKKELLQRLCHQQPSSTTLVQPEMDKPTITMENNSNQILPPVVAQTQPNVKSRLVSKKSESLTTASPQKIPPLQTPTANVTFQGQEKKIVKQVVQKKVVASAASRVQQVQPALSATQQTVKVAPIQGKPPQQRLGTKRTVVQRSNNSSAEVAPVAPKVRMIKLSTAGENILLGTAEGNPQPPIPQQRIPPQQRIVSQQRPQMQQRAPQKTGPVRKVTLGKTSVQQQQQQQLQPQQYQVKPRPQLSMEASTGPQFVNNVQGPRPGNKVIMRGRGRGVGGQMGRGRLMPNKQNLHVVECKPRVVLVEGLSSSTTDLQLRSLLMSVGPITDLQMFPSQRKAKAAFENPNDALQFQQKFHRHMIDLSHINVSLVSE